MSLTQDVTRTIEALNRDISGKLENVSSDGWVANSRRLALAYVLLQVGIGKMLLSNGMTDEEIMKWLNLSQETLEGIKQNDLPKMEVGAVVEPIDPFNPLRSSCGTYPAAVVISMEPFVLVSPTGDMRWSTRKVEEFQVVAQMQSEDVSKLMHRLHE